jgi:hypothetical protein
MQLVKAEEQKITPTVIWRYEVPIYDDVVSVSVSSDGSYIAVLTRNGFFLLFSRDGRLLGNYSIGYYNIHSVSISSDGSYIALGAEESLGSRDAIFLFSRDGRLLWKFDNEVEFVNSVSISSDGSYIVAGVEDHRPSSFLLSSVLLLSRDGRLLWNYSIGYYNIEGVSISSDGSYMAVGARDPHASRCAIFLFSRDGRLLWNYSICCFVVSVSISSDGSYIVAGVEDRLPSSFLLSSVLLLSRDGRLLWNYSIGYYNIEGVSISSDGSYMATSLSDTIYFFGLSRKALSPFLTLYDPQIAGLTVSINGTTAPGYKDAKITRIHWDWGDGFSEDHSFPASHTYRKPGTYTITVTVYQSDGLSTTKTLTLKVEAESSRLIVDFSYSPPLPLAGEAVSFIDKSYDPDGNIVLWHWDFGDGATSSDRNPTHVYISPGNYTVTLTVRDNKGAEKRIVKTIQVEAVQTVRTSKSKYLFTLAIIMLGVLIVLTISYILAKRRAPKPPPLPPPPPPS